MDCLRVVLPALNHRDLCELMLTAPYRLIKNVSKKVVLGISSGIYGEDNYVATYGRLYSWYVAADNRNVCPTGWHVPGENEWNILLSNVSSPAELKESGTAHWLSPNTGATNSVLFTALPGGYSAGTGIISLNEYASFHFKNETNATTGRGYMLYYNNIPNTGSYVSFGKEFAFSIRCLKD